MTEICSLPVKPSGHTHTRTHRLLNTESVSSVWKCNEIMYNYTLFFNNIRDNWFSHFVGTSSVLLSVQLRPYKHTDAQIKRSVSSVLKPTSHCPRSLLNIWSVRWEGILKNRCRCPWSQRSDQMEIIDQYGGTGSDNNYNKMVQEMPWKHIYPGST